MAPWGRTEMVGEVCDRISDVGWTIPGGERGGGKEAEKAFSGQRGIVDPPVRLVEGPYVCGEVALL